MGSLKAALIVLAGLAALGGGAVLVRDDRAAQLSDLLRVALQPAQDLPEAPPTAAPSDPAPAAPAVRDPVVDVADPAEAPPEPAPVAPTYPKIDVVRLEPDGSALVSGTGAPRDRLEVLVDGVAVWSGHIDDQGSFVAFLDLPVSPIARMMWLRSITEEGQSIQSDGSVVLAPSPQRVLADAPESAAPEAEGPDFETTVAIATAPEQPAAEAAAVPTGAPALPTLRSDRDGVRPLAPAPVAPDQGLAVDTVRYGTAGEVILEGRTAPTPRGDLAIYLDGEVAARTTASGTGQWQAILADVPTGTYQLRADLTDETGRVAARVDLPFRREAPERVQAAQIAAVESDQEAALVTVQPGYSLWAIARDRYGDGFQYVAVYEANSDQIQDPNLIFPGQVLSLPEGATLTIE